MTDGTAQATPAGSSERGGEPSIGVYCRALKLRVSLAEEHMQEMLLFDIVAVTSSPERLPLRGSAGPEIGAECSDERSSMGPCAGHQYSQMQKLPPGSLSPVS